jgi:hypothetical protein
VILVFQYAQQDLIFRTYNFEKKYDICIGIIETNKNPFQQDTKLNDSKKTKEFLTSSFNKPIAHMNENDAILNAITTIDDTNNLNKKYACIVVAIQTFASKSTHGFGFGRAKLIEIQEFNPNPKPLGIFGCRCLRIFQYHRSFRVCTSKTLKHKTYWFGHNTRQQLCRILNS